MHDETGYFQFRIVHIIYIVTLMATSLATFGAGGLLPGGLVSIFWASVFTSRSRPKAFGIACVVILLGSCLASLLLPAFTSARESARYAMCAGNLRQIAVALHMYENSYGSFPPAYIAAEDGTPMHSWRVLLLPFLDAQGVYDKYSFDEPWNGPNNIKLLHSMPPIYLCPSASLSDDEWNSCTSYVAVVGPHTAWPGTTPRRIPEITDGLPNTMLLIESNELVPWLEPRDLQLEEAVDSLASVDWAVAPHKTEDFFFQYSAGRCVAFADVSVRLVSNGLGREAWSEGLQVNDGRLWDEDDFQSMLPARRPQLGNWIRLGVFFVLVLFPLPWVWLNPESR
jgi:hypothetical protein